MPPSPWMGSRIKCRKFTGGEVFFESVEVAEVDELDAGEQRAETGGPEAVIHERERSAGKAVKRGAGGE